MKVNVRLHDPLNIQIDVPNRDYLLDVKEHFTTFTDGYRYDRRWQSGQWDGRISIFQGLNRTLPFGLVTDLMRFHKESYPTFELKVDPKIKEKFTGVVGEIILNEKDNIWPLRDYQRDCVLAMLRSSCGIIRLATRGGKTFTLFNTWKYLFEHGLISKQLVIVPSIGLVKQFKKDWLSYGAKSVGGVDSSSKEWDADVVVSTWQSLKNHVHRLDAFQSVMVDECHGSSAFHLSRILQLMPEVKWRWGCTGTMPDNKLQDWNVRSFLGPILKEYSSHYLKQLGFISESMIHIYKMNYKVKFEKEVTFDQAKDILFKKEVRLNLIRKIINEANNRNVLILVGRVDVEGKFLQDYLNGCPEFIDKQVVFLSGKDDGEVREQWRMHCREHEENNIIIATYPIFQMGVDIPNLAHLILGSSFKSKIRILQSIGRILTQHESKNEGGAHVYDIADQAGPVKKQIDTRIKYYVREKFSFEEVEIKE